MGPSGDAPGELHLRFDPGMGVPAAARDALTAHLRGHGVHGEDLEDAVLVGNEMVTNAVEHARTPLLLTTRTGRGAVVITVQDGSTEPPRLRPHQVLSRRGRGLQLVAALAEEWDWEIDGAGKTVRAVVPLRRDRDHPA